MARSARAFRQTMPCRGTAPESKAMSSNSERRREIATSRINILRTSITDLQKVAHVVEFGHVLIQRLVRSTPRNACVDWNSFAKPTTNFAFLITSPRRRLRES